MATDPTRSVWHPVDGSVALNSPAVSDGVPAWENWIQELDALPDDVRQDSIVLAERQRAERTLGLLRALPNGLSPQAPGFSECLMGLLRSDPVMGDQVLRFTLSQFVYLKRYRPRTADQLRPATVEEIQALFDLDLSPDDRV